MGLLGKCSYALVVEPASIKLCMIEKNFSHQFAQDRTELRDKNIHLKPQSLRCLLKSGEFQKPIRDKKLNVMNIYKNEFALQNLHALHDCLSTRRPQMSNVLPCQYLGLIYDET